MFQAEEDSGVDTTCQIQHALLASLKAGLYPAKSSIHSFVPNVLKHSVSAPKICQHTPPSQNTHQDSASGSQTSTKSRSRVQHHPGLESLSSGYSLSKSKSVSQIATSLDDPGYKCFQKILWEEVRQRKRQRRLLCQASSCRSSLGSTGTPSGTPTGTPKHTLASRGYSFATVLKTVRTHIQVCMGMFTCNFLLLKHCTSMNKKSKKALHY